MISSRRKKCRSKTALLKPTAIEQYGRGKLCPDSLYSDVTMAEVLSAPTGPAMPSHPRNILEDKPRPPPNTVTIPQLSTSLRNKHIDLDVFSPVNQNGSFEFDRVLKSGEVYKRTRKTKVIMSIPTYSRSLTKNAKYSNGRNSTSSSARTSSPSTKTFPKNASTNKLISPT